VRRCDAAMTFRLYIPHTLGNEYRSPFL
jgi:hypothetical protein